MKDSRKRYVGLDVHKHYLIAIGVDDELNVVLPVRRVEFSYLEAWMKKTLTKQDEVVLEMTTNTWQLYDELCQHAGAVLVVLSLIHISEPTRQAEISYAVFCLKK